MSLCPHVPLSSCPSVPASFCPHVPVSPCPSVLCPSVPASLCPHAPRVPMSLCPSVPLPFHFFVPVSLCPHIPLSLCPSVPVSVCPCVPLSWSLPRSHHTPRYVPTAQSSWFCWSHGGGAGKAEGTPMCLSRVSADQRHSGSGRVALRCICRPTWQKEPISWRCAVGRGDTQGRLGGHGGGTGGVPGTQRDRRWH